MTYIVCEIGQNHNGSVELAKSLIDVCSLPVIDEFNARELEGINAIKLVKRDLEYECDYQTWHADYGSPHAFGRTYGEHREALELSIEEHASLAAYAKSKRLGIVETICAPSMVGPIVKVCNPTYLKVASRDLTNIPLIERMAETKKPIILSTGMAATAELDAAIATVVRHHECISILHCLSQYPADYRRLNVRTVGYLRRKYNYPIGYSDHSIGLMAPILAVALGAEIIEKHITLSRRMKGTDHAGSLDPEGVWRLCRDIRNAEDSLGHIAFYYDEAAEPARKKLERSICSDGEIKAGETLTEDNTCLLSPGTGFQWPDRDMVLGHTAKTDIPPKTIIQPWNLGLDTTNLTTVT
jgi:sialic acid synthase